eukprot:TRINITY_DN12384_c0_g1_i1.p1 TRINITY_DN12384_c0_g1~~TRINITY_DN12384_c0_g1_i1.p1  ORF type:complete len:116 (+),score=27.56 TRINITY_DN12384_c0_g1_i1:73-420(+)
MPGKAPVPREQWRSRSKKSRVQRHHRLKLQVLQSNLEKVENIQYSEERRARDQKKVEQGLQPAGHHNLPADLFQQRSPPRKRRKATGPRIGAAIGLISRNAIRRHLAHIFALEKA